MNRETRLKIHTIIDKSINQIYQAKSDDLDNIKFSLTASLGIAHIGAENKTKLQRQVAEQKSIADLQKWATNSLLSLEGHGMHRVKK